MTKKNIITITNLYGMNKSIEVENFSDENVKNGLGKLMSIKPKDLQCLSASMGSGHYQVTKKYRGLRDEVQTNYALFETSVVLDVSYGDLFE